MARNYAALYHEYLEEMAALTDEEFGRLCRDLIRFSRDGVEIAPAADQNERFYAYRVMQRETETKSNYAEKVERNRRNGAKHTAKNLEDAARSEEVQEEDAIIQQNPTEPKTTQQNPEEAKATQKGEYKSKYKSKSKSESKSVGGDNPPVSPLAGGPDPTATAKHKETQEEMYDRLAAVFEPGVITDNLDHEIRLWLRYKTERKEAYKESGMAALLRKIVLDETMKHGEKKVCSLIEECMASGYRGIIWDRIDKPQGSYAGNRGRPTDIVEQMKDW